MLPGERGITPLRPDYFLAHRPTQPKREVADYVESQGGILVPQRFAGLSDALDSGKPFIVRSEHPQDYDGASGVFESLVISPGKIEEAIEGLADGRWDHGHRPGKDPRDFARLVLEAGALSQEEFEARLTQASSGNAEVYCRYAGISLEGLLDQVSYSYWELAPGLNRTMVADSAVRGRYHISSPFINGLQDPAKRWQSDNYIIVQNGEIVAGEEMYIAEDSPENIRALIEAYEKIRNLGRFSPSNCSIIEFQSDDSGQYFLQYLRGRDFKAPEFDLERDPEEDEISATLAIGATPQEGLDVGVTYIELFSPNYELPATEAVLNKFVLPMFVEPLVKSTRVQIIPTGGLDDIFAKSRGHTPRSILFKPEISVLFLMRDLERIMSSKTGYPRVDYDPGKNTFRVRIVSDGRRAYLKRTA